jgi:hypothetical protein
LSAPIATAAGYRGVLGSCLARGPSPVGGVHDHGMADDPADTVTIRGAPVQGGTGPARHARLARHDGDLHRTERGWTWRGRLPIGAIAPLLRSASRGRPEPLQELDEAPRAVWLRAVWFDAETGAVACELGPADADVAARSQRRRCA